MSPLRRRLLRLLALLGTLACPLVLALLLEIRPPLPALPQSLSSPITLAVVRGTLDLAAWGASVALAGLLLVHSLRGLFAGRPPPPSRALHLDPAAARRRRPLGQARLAAAAGRGGFPPPFPLILRAHAERERDPEPALALAPARERGAAAAAPARRSDEPAAPPEQALPAPSIALLGPLTITPPIPRRHGLRSLAQQLLAYLALHPEGATTDELAAALCPDAEDQKTRKRLWRSVSEARSQLGDVFRRTDERYRLDRRALAVDLDCFEQLLTEADAQPADERQQLLEQALALVHGQPLAGSDYPWAVGEIRRLRATIVDRFEELAHLRLDDGNPAGALAAAEQAIALDPYNETAHRLAMHAESLLGLRQAISERYEQLRSELDTRLGLEPDRETRLLYRRLLSQDAGEH